jgi:hypothetical protein
MCLALAGGVSSECASRGPGPQVYQLAEGRSSGASYARINATQRCRPAGRFMSKYRKAFLIWLATVTAICGTMVVLHYTCGSCRAYEMG